MVIGTYGGNGGPALNAAKRQRKTWVDHYQCTDWYHATADQPDNWQYSDTTCQYMDSFYIPDGGGLIGGYTGGVISGTGGATAKYRNADHTLKGCSSKDATASKAESRYIVSNSNYEYAGFVLQDASGNLYFSQGQLLSLADNIADIGSPYDHAFPDSMTVVGFYHTHPNTSSSTLDSNTGGHFSAADEAYANAYNLTAYVMDVWEDTSSGTAQSQSAFYAWDHGSTPSADKSVSPNLSC